MASSSLIHDMFNATTNVLEAFKARSAAKGIDFERFSWVGPTAAPEFDPYDPETVVVLDATLTTIQRTFEFAWAWTVNGQDDEYSQLLSDVRFLRLLSDDREYDEDGDGPDFKPWTLSWRRIKLDTNVNAKPIDVRDLELSPGCALLFMAAEHPARIKATDYKTRFGFWLPGLKYRVPGEKQLRDTPWVDFNRHNRRVRLHSYPNDSSSRSLSVPSFRK